MCFELETTHGYEYEGYMYGVEHVIAEWPIKGIRESVLNTWIVWLNLKPFMHVNVGHHMCKMLEVVKRKLRWKVIRDEAFVISLLLSTIDKNICIHVLNFVRLLQGSQKTLIAWNWIGKTLVKAKCTMYGSETKW